jgi:iron complex outermembrane receptor protein
MRQHALFASIQFALACALASGGALAAEPATAVAVGSRLAQAPEALPVTVITRAQIDATGHVLVADVLRDLVQAPFGSFRPQSGSTAQAMASVDLRGLGSRRTLVLVDGRRVAANPMSASSGADLNALPLAMVERIEVYASGASAIYGEDAVGGVVNLVTRRDFEGAELSLGHGASAVEGGDLDAMSVLFGAATERTRVVGGASRARRGMVFTRDQEGGGVRGINQYANNYYDWNTGQLRPVPGFACDEGAFYRLANGLCSFDFNAVAANEAKLGQTAVFLRGEHQVNDQWQVYGTASVTRVESFGRYAPTPGIVVVEDGTPNDIEPGDGLPTYYYHRFAAAGNRDTFTDATRSEFVAGFQGALTERLDLDAGLRRTDYQYKDLGRGYIVSDLAELLANQGLYDLADPFGAAPEVLSGMQATISRDARWQDDTVYATLGAGLFTLAGGESRAVFGVERVRTRYRDTYDSLSEAGRVLGTAGNSAGGDRELTAVFAEWRLPFTPTFDLTLAARHDDYDRLDGQFSPQASLRWQPFDALTLRAHWGQGFRTPGLDITTQQPVPGNESINDPATCLALGLPSSCLVGVPVLAIGNTELAPEQSEHQGLGLVYQPMEALRVSLDYTRLRVTDRITRYQAQDVVLASIDPATYGALPAGLGISRGPDGAVRGIVVGYGNGGADEVDALDLAIDAGLGLGRFGELRSELQVSHVLRYEIFSPGGSGFRFDGRFGYPNTRARLATTWSWGDVELAWQAKGIEGHGNAATQVGAYVTHDLQLAWKTPWRGTLAAGVTNLGDRQPAQRAFDERPYNFYLYDAYGRTPYLRYTQAF